MTEASDKDHPWDACTEAIRAFELTDDVKAVIFCSEVAVIKKADRGPSRRQREMLLRKIKELIRSGNYDEARAEIDQTSWKGPQTIWWTSSIPELTGVINHHDDTIRERRIAAGVSIEEFLPDPRIVFFHVWWDR